MYEVRYITMRRTFDTYDKWIRCDIVVKKKIT